MNPWKILGVSRQSSDEEVRASYLALMKKLHPDLKKGNADKCAVVNEAYSILKDKKKTSIFIKDMIIWNEECRTCKGTGVVFKQRGLLGRDAKPCTVCGGAGVLFKEGRKK